MKYRITTMDTHTWRVEEYDGETSIYLYLLEGKTAALLIDTGIGMVDTAALVRTLTALPVYVLNTHGHFDHIGGNPLFEMAFLHEADREVFRLHCSKAFRALFPHYQYRRQRENLRLIREGVTFDLGGRPVRIFHTPGHSRGSVCALDVGRGWLFTGDTCCRGDVLLYLAGSASLAEYAASLRRLQALKTQFSLTWPAHHAAPVPPSILDSFERGANMLLRGDARGEPIETVLGAGLRFCCGEIAIAYRPDRLFPQQS